MDSFRVTFNPPAAAIILAGGTSRRLHGRDKTRATIDGRTLTERAVAAAQKNGITNIIVVGPETPELAHLTAPVRFVVEKPRFGGPACAVAAGIQALPERLSPDATVVVLACDYVHPDALISTLLDEAENSARILVADGHTQWTAVAARLTQLRDVFTATAEGEPLRARLIRLHPTHVEVPAELAADIDTLIDVGTYNVSLPPLQPTPRRTSTMSFHPDLLPWVEKAAAALGMNKADVPLSEILSMTKTVAHEAVRPGAPVSAFMVGLALGRGDARSIDEAVAAVEKAAHEWASEHPTAGDDSQ